MAHDSNGIISSSPEDLIISENVVRSDALFHNSVNSVCGGTLSFSDKDNAEEFIDRG